MGIWLKDGTYEPLIGDEREAMARLIHEKLGFDAERKFLELSDRGTYYEGYDDGYAEGYEEGYDEARSIYDEEYSE